MTARPLSVLLATPCVGVHCENELHCDGCDQCKATTVLRMAVRNMDLCRGQFHLDREALVRYCDDCAAIVNTGRHDTYVNAWRIPARTLVSLAGEAFPFGLVLTIAKGIEAGGPRVASQWIRDENDLIVGVAIVEAAR